MRLLHAAKLYWMAIKDIQLTTFKRSQIEKRRTVEKRNETMKQLGFELWQIYFKLQWQDLLVGCVMSIGKGEAMIKLNLEDFPKQRKARARKHLAELLDSLIFFLSLSLLKGKFRAKLSATGGLEYLDN